MRKGFTQTLMAVAVVMMAVQAMATAPTIGNIPSPVVGNLESTTPANAFVFPDAINLSNYVTDTETSPTYINWSYEVIGATSKYQINGLAPLTAGEALHPEDPPVGKIIAGIDAATATDPNQGTDASKITIRNSNLSPIGGSYTVPGTTGVIEDETQLVTLYASDGTTFSAKDVWFYTTSQENDKLSGAIPVAQEAFDTDEDGFGFNPGNDGIGSVTSSYDVTNGQICMTTIVAGDNLNKWAQPFGRFELVANNIYRIRATINGDQANVDDVPWWDLIINNYGYTDPAAKTGLSGMNLYGGNYMFLSKFGGANAATSGKSPMVFELWWCPSPLVKTEWNDTTDDSTQGPFGPDNATAKDGFIEFRILDVASNGGANGAATGTMCLTNLTVDRFPYASLEAQGAALYDTSSTGITSGGQDGTSDTGNTRVENSGSTAVFETINTTENVLTFTPTSTTGMLSHITPGDFTYDLSYTVEDTWLDNYPAATAKQALYLITVTLSAPTQTDADNPIDQFWIGADSVDNELINLSYVTITGWHAAMPTTTPQDYKFLFYSNYGTDGASWLQNIRPRMMLTNSAGLGGSELNTGKIRVHNMKVEQVNIPE